MTFADSDLALVKTFVGRPFPWNSLQLYSQSNCCLVNSKLSFSSPIDLTHTIIPILKQHRIVISLIRNTSFYFHFKFTVNPAVCHFPPQRTISVNLGKSIICFIFMFYYLCKRINIYDIFNVYEIYMICYI